MDLQAQLHHLMCLQRGPFSYSFPSWLNLSSFEVSSGSVTMQLKIWTGIRLNSIPNLTQRFS